VGSPDLPTGPVRADGSPRERHVDAQGGARMVDVGGKPEQRRRATAQALVRLAPAAHRVLASGALAKGDALAVARIAAIQAAKRTADIIPLCHPLPLDNVSVDIDVHHGPAVVSITVEVRTTSRTGVEMEALTGASAGALAIYDMTKGEEGTPPVIESVRVLEKVVEGGQPEAPLSPPPG
jgi:cyclic pyranopterin monophosphate synthase